MANQKDSKEVINDKKEDKKEIEEKEKKEITSKENKHESSDEEDYVKVPKAKYERMVQQIRGVEDVAKERDELKTKVDQLDKGDITGQIDAANALIKRSQKIQALIFSNPLYAKLIAENDVIRKTLTKNPELLFDDDDIYHDDDDFVAILKEKLDMHLPKEKKEESPAPEIPPLLPDAGDEKNEKEDKKGNHETIESSVEKKFKKQWMKS